MAKRQRTYVPGRVPTELRAVVGRATQMTGKQRHENEHLEALRVRANADPLGAIAEADDLLGAPCDSRDQVALHRIRGMAFRILGRLPEARRAYAEARSVARAIGDRTLTAKVDLSDSLAQAQMGDVDGALDRMGLAEPDLRGLDRSDLRFQRAAVLGLSGRYGEARRDLTAALAGFRRAGHTVWQADALLNRSLTAAYMGDLGAARRDTEAALGLFEEAGDATGRASALHNLAWLQWLSGQSIAAVLAFDEAEREMEAAGFPVDLIHADRCEALMTVGLNDQAIALAERGVKALRRSGNELERADQQLVLARALNAAGRHDEACEEAAAAAAAFRDQGQEQRWLRSQVVLGEAELALGAGAGTLRRRIEGLATRLAAEGIPEWEGEALLLAARTAGADEKRVVSLLDRHASRSRPFRQEIERLELLASYHRRAGRLGQALRSVRRAMRIGDTANQAIGSAEVRAGVSRHIIHISQIGVDALVRSGRHSEAMRLLEHIDRMVGLGWEPATEPALTSRYRALTRARVEAEAFHRDCSRIDRELAAVRRQISISRRGAGPRGSGPVAPPRPLVRFASTGDAIVRLDRGSRRTKCVSVGSPFEVAREVGLLVGALRRFLVSDRKRDLRIMAERAASLDQRLGRPGAAARDADVLRIVACAEVANVPWGLLPSVRSRPWTKVVHGSPPIGKPRTDESVVVVAGPGLAQAAEETRAVTDLHPNAVRLDASHATVPLVVGAMEGAMIVHIAAHARMVAESPWFSAIELADGPLAVHELISLDPPPRTAVVATCDSASTVSVGLAAVGLGDAMVAAGVGTVIGSVCELPDDPETIGVMIRLHEGLRRTSAIDAAHDLLNDASLAERELAIAGALVPTTTR